MDDKRDPVTEAVKRLRGELADTEAMLKAIEGARMQLSSTADELFARVEKISDRVHIHRLELDKITTLLKRPR